MKPNSEKPNHTATRLVLKCQSTRGLGLKQKIGDRSDIFFLFLKQNKTQ